MVEMNSLKEEEEDCLRIHTAQIIYFLLMQKGAGTDEEISSYTA